MKYYIPTILNANVIQKIGIEAPSLVKVTLSDLATPDNCYNNVLAYLESNDGSLQFGWKFAILGNVIVRLIGHAVIRTPDLKLKCITPQTDNKTEILFSPDDIIKDLIVENYLPCRHISLVENDQVKAYAKLLDYGEALRAKYRIDSPQYQAELAQLNWLASASISNVLKAAKQYTEMDQPCYCGSHIIRNLCCK